MGETCPTCQTHQARVQTITSDFMPAKKADTVIAHKLACGHIVGGKEFTEYQERAKQINEAYESEKQRLDANRKKQLKTIAAELLENAKGGSD